MALGADLLLQSSSPARSATSASSASDASSGGSKPQGSSFSELYARERGASATPRTDTSAKPHAGGEHTARQAANEDPKLADTGKDLPAELPPEDVLLESLMLFGLDSAVAGQTATTDPTASVPTANVVPGEETAAQAVDELLAAQVAMEEGVAAEQTTQNIQTVQADPTEAAELAAAAAALQPSVVPASPASNGRSAAPSLSEQRATATRFASPEPALAATTAPVSESDAQYEQIAAELEDATATRASASSASTVGTELRSETPPSNVNPLTQAVAQANAAQHREAQAVAMEQQPLSMRQGGWSEAVVERVMWLSSQNLKSAEIQLDPAELGRLEVRISLNQEQTQVSFASPHAGVRDALEGQLQRLREMFNQQGMNLMDVNVSDQSLARGERQADEGDGRRGIAALGDDAPDLEEVTVASTALDSGRGLVDFYA